MITINIGRYEIERGVHVLSQTDHDELMELVGEDGDLAELLMDCDIETGYDEWYDGLEGGCYMVLDDDYISAETDDMVELDMYKFKVDNTKFDMKDILKNEKGEYVMVAQHISKGGMSVELDIDDADFDSSKLKFITSTYTGEYMYTDRLLVSIEYDGEHLDFELGDSSGKSFEVDMYDFDDCVEEG